MGWISIKERLPEETINVVVWFEDTENPLWSNYAIGMLEDDKWYLRKGRENTQVVTHWMPLLEPPVKAETPKR
jgi:hypothetical protein